MISSRIKEIRELSLLRGKLGKETHFNYDFYSSFFCLYENLPHYERYAKSMAYAIVNQDVWAYEEDRIGGRIYYTNEKSFDKFNVIDSEKEVLNRLTEIYPDIEELRNNQLISRNSKGHITWLFDKILKFGIDNLKEKYIKAINETKDDKAIEFYKGVLILFDALLEFNDKHINEYEKLKNYELANIMKKVPRYPASTFKEAVQSFYMQHIVVMRENPFGGNGPGRLDYYLWPYLKKDLELGLITLEEAKEIIDELFLRFEERLYNMDMWVEAIVVGGTNPDGSSSFNLLTHIMIESFLDLKIIHPAIYIRVPIKYDEEILKICSRFILEGNNRAQILNDKSIINALISNGVPFEDAVFYACGGCMEINIQGKNSDFLYVGWQNCAKMLELMITGGICLKTLTRQECFHNNNSLEFYDNFEDFYLDFIKEATRLTNISLHQQEIYSEYDEIHRPSFLISSMIDDCFERGRNMHGGGARYHDYGGTHLALPNVIDGLYAIKVSIFDNKICTKKELIDALKNNFVGYEKLQDKLKNIPKYGEDNLDVDTLAKRVMRDFANMYLNYKTRHGGKGKPTILTFIYSPAAASILGATPDGRNAFSKIAQGITPHYLSMKKGITAAINSCCKLNFDFFYGGASSMWNFDSIWVNENIIFSLLKTFIDNNGQIFQGNTTPIEDLVDAKYHPEKYEHLIVRVGGYSAKFVNLWKELQDEVIERYRHNK